LLCPIEEGEEEEEEEDLNLGLKLVTVVTFHLFVESPIGKKK
jgi:hypothetical protein